MLATLSNLSTATKRKFLNGKSLLNSIKKIEKRKKKYEFFQRIPKALAKTRKKGSKVLKKEGEIFFLEGSNES